MSDLFCWVFGDNDACIHVCTPLTLPDDVVTSTVLGIVFITSHDAVGIFFAGYCVEHGSIITARVIFNNCH